MPLDLPLGAPGAPRTDVTAEQDGALVRRTVLPGGVRVLTERMAGVRSVSVGASVAVGSRDETDGHHGSTHFLEHLLFKGTRRRTALDIAEAFDAVGGEANAATGKEDTTYYARVVDRDLPMALDVIADMVTSAELAEEEVELEREVILEELAMTEDDPTDVVHEAFAATVLSGHDLGRPIGGTPEAITAVPRAAVWDHYRAHYRPDSLVVSAAGGVDHDDLCARLLDALAAGGWDLAADAAPRARRSVATPGLPTADTTRTIRRDTGQANVIVGGPGLRAGDERRFVLAVLTAVLGGGMSSRLFQEVREKRGLAYSVYSFSAAHSDTGTFGLYAGCAPAKVEVVTDLLTQQWDRLATDPISRAELDRAVGQLSGSLVLGLEDSSARMSRLGRSEMVHGQVLSQSDVLERIGAVTPEQVRQLAADLAGAPRSIVRVGPFGD